MPLAALRRSWLKDAQETSLLPKNLALASGSKVLFVAIILVYKFVSCVNILNQVDIYVNPENEFLYCIN